jgi:N-glycosylase/DNA lyase
MAQHIAVRDFNLRHTLECGQFFRWRCADGVYTVQTRDVVFRAWQDGDRLYFSGVPGLFVRTFFALDHDLPSIVRAIDRDAWMHEAVRRYAGLRILRQDRWECTAAFITSIASNIPRITGNIEDMAVVFGSEVRNGSLAGRQFPTPDRLVDERRLRSMRLGFRAKYLVDAARLVNAGLLEDVSAMSGSDARDALMVMPGVAEKVADCVLLFAYGRLDAFPVDTWIRKVMSRLYFEGRDVTDLQIRRFAARYFGRYAGYAQQYLYVWSREHWREIDDRPKSDTSLIRELAKRVLEKKTTRRFAALAR